MFNCNSLLSKLSDIKLMLSQQRPDLVCFSETWLNGTRMPKFSGYSAQWLHREDRGGGGLGYLVRDGLTVVDLPVSAYPTGVLEFQAFSLALASGRLLNIISLYNPSQNVTLPEFQHLLGQLTQPFLVVGDFNAHSPLLMSGDSSNITGRSLEALLLEMECLCLANPIDMFTYTDRTTAARSCLDL